MNLIVIYILCISAAFVGGKIGELIGTLIEEKTK